MFHGKVCLWLDRDYMKDEGEDVGLCHAFAKIADGFYVDAAGPFFDISDRDNYYEYNEKRIVECTVEEAKKILKNVGTPSVSRKKQKVFQLILKLSCAAAIGAGIAVMFMSL